MNKKKKYIVVLVLAILLATLTIGYSLLSTTLNISGSSGINNPTWNIFFDNVDILDGSVELSTGDSAATINPTNPTQINYTVTLNQPGDYYEFLVDVVNDGTIDAMIDSFSYKINGAAITSENLPPYLEYAFEYEDGTTLKQNQILLNGEAETFFVHVGYKKDIEKADLPTTDQTYTFQFTIDYVQANDDAIEVRVNPISFEDDDWATIAGAARSGNTAAYSVGDTKEIDLGEYGVHTVRIANLDTREGCSTGEVAGSSCGLIVEFADIITNHEATNMTSFLNSIFAALPADLQNEIAEVEVPYRNPANNSVVMSAQKLFLLDEVEVYGDTTSITATKTKQLDYYADAGVTLTEGTGLAIKKYEGINSAWYLRNPSSTTNTLMATTSGTMSNISNDTPIGVSPAFGFLVLGN